MARTQAEAQLTRQTARLKILADASQAFATVGLDYQALLEQVAQQISQRYKQRSIERLPQKSRLSDGTSGFFTVSSPYRATTHTLPRNLRQEDSRSCLLQRNFQIGQCIFTGEDDRFRGQIAQRCLYSQFIGTSW